MSTEIIEGEIEIAKFMGYKFSGDGITKHFNICNPDSIDWYFGSWPIEDFNEHIEQEFKYHSSWDWQIPTWGKIALAVKTLLADKKYSHMDVDAYLKKVEKYDNAVFQNKPEDGQKIIVELIKWYQNQILNNTIN